MMLLKIMIVTMVAALFMTGMVAIDYNLSPDSDNN